MSAGRHVALGGFALRGIYYGVEEVGFAMLAAEILEGGGISLRGLEKAGSGWEYVHER